MPNYKQIPIYTEAGWIDIKGIVEYDPENLCWIYVVDTRGAGKTFGVLKYAVERADSELGQFIYMRRSQEQCDLISRQELSPVNALNKELGWDLLMDPITKKNSGIYHSETNKDGRTIPKGDFLGITAGLSTFRNLRGLSLEGVTLMIYDEFVPERNERPLRSEGFALQQAYETVNRNRELAGKAPLICLCLGNADDLGNRVFMDLGWTERAEWMIAHERECYYDYGRRTALYIPQSSPIAKAKAETALYQMSGRNRFTDMAIRNRFAQQDLPNIKPRRLEEYRPVVETSGLCIYRHKDRLEYYCSRHKTGSPERYNDDPMDMDRFRKKYIYLWDAYVRDIILFESYMCMREFETLFTG